LRNIPQKGGGPKKRQGKKGFPHQGNTLKEKAGIPVTNRPDRRRGASGGRREKGTKEKKGEVVKRKMGKGKVSP